VVLRNQQHAILITIVVTALAATLGLLFAILVSGGITRPVRLLLEGTREIEAGHLERSIEVITADEIGQLSAAFNRMVEQLRHKEQHRFRNHDELHNHGRHGKSRGAARGR
jgi:nitrogen fixation/metabolism regulation signal transduction histidine kinase